MSQIFSIICLMVRRRGPVARRVAVRREDSHGVRLSFDCPPISAQITGVNGTTGVGLIRGPRSVLNWRSR